MDNKFSLFDNVIYRNYDYYDENFKVNYDYSKLYCENVNNKNKDYDYFLNANGHYVKMQFISCSYNPSHSLYETMDNMLSQNNGIDCSNDGNAIKYNHFCKYENVILIFSILFIKKTYSSRFMITCISKNGYIYDFEFDKNIVSNNVENIVDVMKFSDDENKKRFINILNVQSYNEVDYIDDIKNANEISHFEYAPIITINGVTAYFKFNNECSRKMSIISFMYSIFFMKDSLRYECETLDEISYLSTMMYKKIHHFDINDEIKKGCISFQNHNVVVISLDNVITVNNDGYICEVIYKLINDEFCYVPDLYVKYSNECHKLTNYISSFKRNVEKLMK